MKKYMIIFLLVGFYSLLFSQVKKSEINPNAPNVEIKGTQVQHFFSEIMNQEYELHINLPGGYDESNEKFPVLFLLDSQWDFPLIQAIYGEQYYDGFVPGLVIVGITWAGENANADILRARDFTPTKTEGSNETGKATEFLKFFRNELIPFVENNFKVSNDRALAGSSLGGLFTLYAMFTETDLFGRYFLTSPAAQWDNMVLFGFEEKYAEKNSDLNVFLYMAIGGHEPLELFNRMIEKIESRNYANLKFDHKVLEGIGHSGSKAEGYTRGMQFIYQKTEISINKEILNKYIGEYEMQPDVIIEISVIEGVLYALAPNNVKIRLNATSETSFYFKGTYGFVDFQTDSNGSVTGFKLKQYGGENILKKIK